MNFILSGEKEWNTLCWVSFPVRSALVNNAMLGLQLYFLYNVRLPVSVFLGGTMQTLFLVWLLFKLNIFWDILNCFVCFHSSQVQEFWLLVSGCVSMRELKDSLLQQIPHLCSSQVRFGHSPTRFISSEYLLCGWEVHLYLPTPSYMLPLSSTWSGLCKLMFG